MPTNSSDRHRRRGAVLVMMALSTAALVAAAGLAVDLGRMFIAKNETQVFCDAGALAAALALDGTSAGITAARAAVNAPANRWDFGTTAVANPIVTFATAAGGPWIADPIPAAGYRYARVTAIVPVRLYFLPVVAARFTSDIVSTAAAGQIDLTSLRRGVAPYTVVSTNPTGPSFGLVRGASYDLQWPQYNSTRAGCGPADPDRCFNSAPCSGEPLASKVAVAANWGANTSGYWGSTSNSAIAAAILDLIQLYPVAVGTNIRPLLTSGNKDSEKVYLDDRASQDSSTSTNMVPAYLASANRNGRRLIPVIIVDPISPSNTTVLGYGEFLLLTNGSPSDYYKRNTTGNEPFCGLYVGPYNIGSPGPGAGGSTGASQAKLIQ
ncbi:MAG TPA: pilus assembly protein TadG-related protein [Bryobacteraceae bacterium]|nr:pilus assembly protein TadG-related protein [Bryobacteraceae bacterium]